MNQYRRKSRWQMAAIRRIDEMQFRFSMARQAMATGVCPNCGTAMKKATEREQSGERKISCPVCDYEVYCS